jgi:hypothetical protein
MNNRIETKKFSFFSKLTMAVFATRMYWIKYDTPFFSLHLTFTIYIYMSKGQKPYHKLTKQLKPQNWIG